MSPTRQRGVYDATWGRIEVEGFCWQLGISVRYDERGPWWRRRLRLVNTRSGEWLTPWLKKRDLTRWVHGFCVGVAVMAERGKTAVAS